MVQLRQKFFNDTATTEIYTGEDTLSLHDALPIYGFKREVVLALLVGDVAVAVVEGGVNLRVTIYRQEETPKDEHSIKTLYPCNAQYVCMIK